jgi:hypothetical protein
MEVSARWVVYVYLETSEPESFSISSSFALDRMVCYDLTAFSGEASHDE